MPVRRSETLRLVYDVKMPAGVMGEGDVACLAFRFLKQDMNEKINTLYDILIRESIVSFFILYSFTLTIKNKVSVKFNQGDIINRLYD